MKINKAINLFKKAHLAYEKASKQEISFEELYLKNLENGICLYINNHDLFDDEGYYRNYTKRSGYIYETPSSIRKKNQLGFSEKTNKYQKSLAFRAKFLKQEIESLINLLEQGYTDI